MRWNFIVHSLDNALRGMGKEYNEVQINQLLVSNLFFKIMNLSSKIQKFLLSEAIIPWM